MLLQALEYDLAKEQRRVLQPDALILTAVLKDGLHEDHVIAFVLEAHLFEAVDVLQAAELLDFLDVRGLVTELDDHALAVDLDVSDALLF